MTATRFRKKPIEVEAVQWTGGNGDEVAAFTGGKFGLVGPNASVYDELHHTWVTVYRGQWVVRGVMGEFYPIAEDVLAETYDRVLADRDGGVCDPMPIVRATTVAGSIDTWQEQHRG